MRRHVQRLLLVAGFIGADDGGGVAGQAALTQPRGQRYGGAGKGADHAGERLLAGILPRLIGQKLRQFRRGDLAIGGERHRGQGHGAPLGAGVLA